jgi:hypothetical protein
LLVSGCPAGTDETHGLAPFGEHDGQEALALRESEQDEACLADRMTRVLDDPA